MSHFGDFMDGVPVKISERYKRPPRIELPYSVIEGPVRAQNVVDGAKYCTNFEVNVLAKIKELRSAKETKKNERRHRLQLLEEEKQKKLDLAAAAEQQQRLQQLSVSHVSYPSTDEITALSPDDKPDCDIPYTCTQTSTEPNNVITTQQTYPTCSNPEPNILQPIQVKAINYPEMSLLDDPISDPLHNLKLNNKVAKPYSHNVEALTFRDFEQDTSSPFDNVELKTINDMELLAQVLQKDSSNCDTVTYIPNQNYANCGTQVNIDGMTYVPNQYMEPVPSGMYVSPQHYPSNGYYTTTDMDNMYNMQNYQYYTPNNYPLDYYNSPIPQNEVQNGATFVPQAQTFFYDYNQAPVQYEQPSYDYKSPETVKTTDIQEPLTQNMVIKSRSRSVPDIVKELNEELALAKQRVNERSYNPSPTPKMIPQPTSSSGKKIERKHRTKIEQLPNPYDKLTPPLQSMCQKIHSMGFPLDRVARICTLVGDSDKKVIEGLLLLGELMDLGFSEGRVSAALAKHEFNRDKALDELVS